MVETFRLKQSLEHISQPRKEPWRGTKANVTVWSLGGWSDFTDDITECSTPGELRCREQKQLAQGSGVRAAGPLPCPGVSSD